MRAHALAAKLLKAPNHVVIISTTGSAAEASHVELTSHTYVDHDGIYRDTPAVAITSYGMRETI